MDNSTIEPTCSFFFYTKLRVDSCEKTLSSAKSSKVVVD